MLRIKFWPWIEARQRRARGQLSALQPRVKRGDELTMTARPMSPISALSKDQASHRMSVRRAMQEGRDATAGEQGGR